MHLLVTREEEERKEYDIVREKQQGTKTAGEDKTTRGFVRRRRKRTKKRKRIYSKRRIRGRGSGL